MDAQSVEAIDADALLRRKPFPWLQAEKLITEEGYRRLREALPDKSRFVPVFGRRRPFGQARHDRYVLQYRSWQSYPEPWQALIEELSGETYRNLIRRLLGHDRFMLHFHWHYTPRGCSVSPHCDAPWKYGSHIFYMNTEDDWDPEWGGDTLLLDDGGRLRWRSAPKFGDFDREIASPSLGNRSLFFLSGEHSWHGVHPIRCPDDALRKVFIVEIRRRTPFMAVRTRLGF